MHRAPRASLILGAFLALMLPAMALAASSLVMDSYHTDHRSTPKLQFDPAFEAPAGLKNESLARSFLASHAEDFALPADLSNLHLVRTQQSLLGTHYHFQQIHKGIEVEGAEIIISVSKRDSRVYRVFNNTYPVKASAGLGKAAITEDGAYDLAWRNLRAHGELLSAPQARLVYSPSGENLHLNYVIDLDLAGPRGSWRQHVDATTGEILALEDLRLPRVKTAETEISPQERIAAYSGPVWDRLGAFARFADMDRIEKAPAGITKASGTGVVFDPDPRTTLNNAGLADGSPASAFTDAYFTRNLLDITFSGGVYRLTGPYVNIQDWDSPSTPPSTTTDGNWTAVRGNNAFNDAMTYFQIDQNQRYMQSLGFAGPTGIQEVSIVADTDGWSGADNSSYSPSTNRLTFGHGCVDDDEDADVILHEYGHAITYGINSSWGGGDMGAIGEGFGDYWAGSYSYSTPNGPVFHPEWIFSWDGHNACWSGRVMDAFSAQYDHSTFYGAHQSIAGGWQSDELWSTPCFQSLISLVALGETRESVDQIILEAQFGLGGGVKMREMANAIIATAGQLQPGEPHAGIFIEKFLVHGIVEIPAALLQLSTISLGNNGSNGAADPGETVDLSVRVLNAGTLGADSITGTLTTSTVGVTVLNSASSYPDLPIGGSAVNNVDFQVAISLAFPCGDPIDLRLELDYMHGENTGTAYLDFELGTGEPLGVQQAVSPELSIPDDNSSGVTSVMTVSGSGGDVTDGFNVDINLTHTWIGDLIVRLTSPSGTQVTLHDRSGSLADDIIGNYPETLTPAQSLSAFIGDPLDGDWVMFISDNAGLDEGVLHSWGINDISGWECEPVETAVGDDTAPQRFAVFQNQPNPFNPATVIKFAVPSDGGLVALEIFDVAGRKVSTLVREELTAGQHSVTWQGRDESGRQVGSGVYFYRLTGRNFSQTNKMILLQ